MKYKSRIMLATVLLAAGIYSHSDSANALVLYDGRSVAPIIYSDQKTTTIAAKLLAHDLKALTGRDTVLSTNLDDCSGVCIVIGDHDSALIKKIAAQTGLGTEALQGQWEQYERVAVVSKQDPRRTYLLITGSDRRGTVYGVVDLTRELGISAFEWWADVVAKKLERVEVSGDFMLSKPPTVRYRGIYLDDVDWSLEPWAAQTFDPAAGDIAPKTYARVFELMWRLKANMIWPSMHAVTKPFWSYQANPVVADEYAIIIGSSTSEPLLRNNISEWDSNVRGPFNFLVNRANILSYWLERAQQSRTYESIYTIGLRGVADSPLLGANSSLERMHVLQEAIAKERDILGEATGRPANTIPQVLTLYKEVEEAYATGLKLPDDITLVWADDSYGYMGRFSTSTEAKRSGGAGVYYHISYWGRPHDYLWLATTHPGLIREEMDRAYQMKADRLWVLNVGGLKMHEYLAQYFLDLAFDSAIVQELPEVHLQKWVARQFGTESSAAVAHIMMRYYDLAFERKPEFMGWGQVEPVTPSRPTEYILSDGEEAQRRIAAYADITQRAEQIASRLPVELQDAFFELILYPVRASANLNRRILSLDLANLFAHQKRASANFYSNQAEQAQASLAADSSHFNKMLGGKWRGILDPAPRRLPVFDTPVYPHWPDTSRSGCDSAFHAQWSTPDDHNALPFTSGRSSTETLTLFGYQPTAMDWQLTSPNDSITVSQTKGRLDEANGFEQRLNVSYDGSESSPAIGADRALTIHCGGQDMEIHILMLPKLPDGLPAERNGAIAIPIAKAVPNRYWEQVPQLGSQGNSLRSRLDIPSIGAARAAAVEPLIYNFANNSDVGGEVRIVALPTHPLNSSVGLRLGVSLDDGPRQVLDFNVLGRSDDWRRNVLSNSAVRSIHFLRLAPGTHRVALYAMDPGFVLDRIEVELDGSSKRYGPIPLENLASADR